MSDADPAIDAVRGAVTAYITALNAADIERITGCVSDDFWNEHIALGSQSLRGREAYRERLKGFLAEYRDLHYAIERTMIEGTGAAVEYTMTYNWAGTQPPAPVTTRGVFLFEVAGGLIARRTDYRDSAQARSQMQATGS